MPRKTNPGRKLISLEAKEAGPEVSKQELLWKSGGTEISSLRKLMQEGVQLFGEGLVRDLLLFSTKPPAFGVFAKPLLWWSGT